MNIDLTLPKAPCAILALDIVDVTGVHEANYEGRLHKHSLFADGTRKGVADALKQKSNKRDQTVILNAARQQVKDKEGFDLCPLKSSMDGLATKCWSRLHTKERANVALSKN